jgi:cysteine desulfurase/selenocysteine lyase
LDSAASSQKPQVVIDALVQYYQQQHANVHRGVYALSASATDLFEASREAVRRYINAASHREIVFVRGTTEGINLVSNGFARSLLSKDDEVLITAMEHHSNIVPWQMACEQTGAKLVVIPVNSKGEIDLDEVKDLLNEKTRILSVVHISNALGTINPVKELTALAHENGIPVLIDGAQAMPHMRIDVRDIDADFYAFSGHKMFGPTGIGVLYGKESWLEKLPPYQGGGEMIKKVRFEQTTYNEIPFKFEAGTPNIADTIGLKAAIEYLEELPQDLLQKHEADLLQYATNRLLQIPGLKIVGQAKDKASVISFIVDGVHPYDIGTLLDHQGIAVRTGHHCAEPLMDLFGISGTVRASFAFYNTRAEIDQLTKAVEKAVQMLS